MEDDASILDSDGVTGELIDSMHLSIVEQDEKVRPPSTYKNIYEMKKILTDSSFLPEQCPHLRSRKSGDANKGMEVYSTEPLKESTWLTEYVGEHISTKAAEQRELEREREGSELIQAMLYYDFYHNTKHYKGAIDGCAGKHISNIFNHRSDDPNVVRVGVYNRENKQLWVGLVTLKDVEAGEPLEWDYGERNKEIVAQHPYLKKENKKVRRL